FELGSVDPRLEALSQVDLSRLTLEPNADTVQQVEGASPESGDFVDTSIGVVGGGIHFPIFEKPASAFKLLLGQNVDLVVFNVPSLQIQAKIPDITIPIVPGLSVFVSGGLLFQTHITIGYDTQGLVDFLKKPAGSRDAED